MPTAPLIPTTLQAAFVNAEKFKEKERIVSGGHRVHAFLTS